MNVLSSLCSKVIERRGEARREEIGGRIGNNERISRKGHWVDVGPAFNEFNTRDGSSSERRVDNHIRTSGCH